MKSLCITVLLYCLLPIPALLAQSDASVSGTVTDPSGAVVPNAQLTLTKLDTNASRKTESNGQGLYSFPDVSPGAYEIQAMKPGFQSLIQQKITLETAARATLNLTLKVGDTTQTVTVSDTAMLVNTTDGTVSTVISREMVDNLPLDGRTFQQLITLTPGVNLTGSAGSTGTQPLGEFSVNGQRATANYFTVDGVSANLALGGSYGMSTNGAGNAAGGTNAMVSVDALQEFRILTSSFAPEYGRTPGGQVVLLTRSGTNQFHGSLYDYFRNTVLEANNWFANQAGQPRAPLQFNDFGGTFAGPLVKNHTFFFFSFEGQRLNEPQFAISSVPDVASRSAAPSVTKFILNAFPLPNGPELGNGLAQFATGYSNPINTNASSIRLDHIFNNKINAFARYSYAPSFSNVREPGDNLAEIYGSTGSTKTLTVGSTYVITPRLIDEVRLNFSDYSVKHAYTQGDFGGATPLPPDSALFVGPYSSSNAITEVATSWGNLNQGVELGLEQRQVNFTDGLSWTAGSHQLKFGLDYLRQLPINQGQVGFFYGFDNVASIVNNSLSYLFADDGVAMHEDTTEFSLYAQDTWRASPRLTLTYGLRWDLNPPPHSRYPNNQDYIPVLIGSTGNVTVGNAGSSYWNTQHTNFAPRLGVAYSLRQTSGWETVLRGGIGLFYDIGSQASAFAGWSDYPTFQYTFLSGVPFPVTPQEVAYPPINLTSPPAGSGFAIYPRDFLSPRTLEWNVSLQQALSSAQTLTLSYVAALGQNLVYGQQYNNAGPLGYTLYLFNNAGASNYQALQLQFQRRLSAGLSVIAGYTWAHSIDTNSDNISTNEVPTTIVNANVNRGPSDFDVRDNFTGAVSYSLPGYAGTKWLAALSKNWGLDAIITARSPLPIDIVSQFRAPFGSYYLRPNLVPGVPLYVANPNVPGGEVINAAGFVVNPNGQGDLGRNALRGFDLVETDLSVRRSFHVLERLNLLFRADVFNLFNHPNFANPNNILNRSFFGESIAMANGGLAGSSAPQNPTLNSAFQTGGPRTVQLSLKLQF